MTPSSSTKTAALRPVVPAEQQFTVWPLAEWTAASVLFPRSVEFVGVAIGAATGEVTLGVISALVMALVIWRFYVPVEFTMNAKGIAQKTPWQKNGRHIFWSAIARCEIRSSGLLMLPNSEARPVDSLQGIFVPWQQNREPILELVRHYAIHAEIVDRTKAE